MGSLIGNYCIWLLTMELGCLIIMKIKDNIMITAALCRQACERYNEAYAFYPKDLCGMCALASQFLFEKLVTFCQPIFIYEDARTQSHCWVRVGNIHIDITATQFRNPFEPCGIASVHIFEGEHLLWNKQAGEKRKRVEASKGEVEKALWEWDRESLYMGREKERLDNFF